MAETEGVGPLKPYTKYQCMAPDCGKASIWTGAYLAVHQRANDDRCKVCGAELVEEIDDGRRWRVSFESVSAIHHPELYAGDRARPDIDATQLGDSYWTASERETKSQQDARQQHDGLNQLIAEGEFIRNVKVEVATTQWEPVDMDAEVEPLATGGLVDTSKLYTVGEDGPIDVTPFAPAGHVENVSIASPEDKLVDLMAELERSVNDARESRARRRTEDPS
jgi:hypothetical protein